ncbi:hypothetical protein D3C81_826270 [compost metagenome]
MRGVRVEAGHRFVGQDHLWSLGQRTGDTHPLHLPARQRIGARPGLVLQLDPAQAITRQCHVVAAKQL